MEKLAIGKKIIIFLGIIGFGIVGLIIADQQDFLSGRTTDESETIGNGNADPLAENADLSPIKTGTASALKSSTQKTTTLTAKKPSEIDGVAPKTVKSFTEIKFTGIIQSYSTGCYADGECSITVGGRKIVTTTGRSQEIVGTIKGVSRLDELENKANVWASVYARKTEDGYTLYGNKNYYVEVLK